MRVRLVRNVCSVCFSGLVYSSRKSTHKEKKRKKSRPSPGVDVEKGDGEVIKLKVEHGLLEELQLTSISTFPKPLGEYTEDRSKLLDEVFAVMSRDDIEGMLPDILKVCVTVHMCVNLSWNYPAVL